MIQLPSTPIDFKFVNKLIELDVRGAVRQNALPKQKEDWNNSVSSMFLKLLNFKIGSELKLEVVSTDATLVEEFRINCLNNQLKKKLEKESEKDINQLLNKLFVDKVIGEMMHIATAKAKQTAHNVRLGQTMKSDDKLKLISEVLPIDTCTICQTITNVYAVVTFPSGMLLRMQLECGSERTTKKGKKLYTLKLSELHKVLAEFKPKLHCTKLCADCANVAVEKLSHPTDPAYGITNLVPQNIITDSNYNKVVVQRMMLLPLIDPAHISDGLDPNRTELSLTRQLLRAFMSKTIGLEVSGTDNLTACLNFLTVMAFDRESAQLIYANVKSMLQGGGKNTRLEDTVNILSQPIIKNISEEKMNWITLVDTLIQLGELPIKVHPKVQKLLFLTNIAEKIHKLVRIKTQINSAKKKLDGILSHIMIHGDHAEKQKFGMDLDACEKIKQSQSIEADMLNQFLGTYLQKNINLGDMTWNEKVLRAILEAADLAGLSDALGIDCVFFEHMLRRSDMTTADLISLIPKFVSDLIAISEQELANYKERPLIDELIIAYC